MRCGVPHAVTDAARPRLVRARRNLARARCGIRVATRVTHGDGLAAQLGARRQPGADEIAIKVDVEDGAAVARAAGELLLARREGLLSRGGEHLEVLLERADEVQARLGKVALEEVGRRRRVLHEPVLVGEEGVLPLGTLGLREPRMRDGRGFLGRVGRRGQVGGDALWRRVKVRRLARDELALRRCSRSRRWARLNCRARDAWGKERADAASRRRRRR